MFDKDHIYQTRSGHEAIVLHSCDSLMKQLIGVITLSDGEEVPAIWTDQGVYFSRACGYVTKSDEFNLVETREEHEP